MSDTSYELWQKAVAKSGTLFRRFTFKSDGPLRQDSRQAGVARTVTPAPEHESNLVSSLYHDSLTQMDEHMPVLDIDVPCRLEPSSTPGHHHLYIDKPMSWETYQGLLEALCSAGVIEHGFHEYSVNLGATFVRKPGVTKQNEQQPQTKYVEQLDIPDLEGIDG
jgi:hypothetical protein